jgi:DNA primase
MRAFADKIKSMVKPSEYIGRKVTLKAKAAGEFVGLCPFHSEKTPSFTVSDNRQFYHCFGCGADSEGVKYKDALEIIAREVGMELPKLSKQFVAQVQEEELVYQIFAVAADYYHRALSLPIGSKGLAYLKGRGLTDACITKFKLGFAPEDSGELARLLKSKFDHELIRKSTVLIKGLYGGEYSIFHGRVIFPIFNDSGKVIAFGGRSIDGAEPKYLNSPENPIFKKGQELFALNFARGSAFKKNQIFVVEGYMDAISLFNVGIENVVAPLGTALKIEQIIKLWQYVDEPTLALDNDSAGYKAKQKVASAICSQMVAGKSINFIDLLDSKDPDEFVKKYGGNQFLELAKKAKSLVDFVFEDLQSQVNTKVPEKIAGFKVKLLEYVENKDIAMQYKNIFLNRFFEFSKSLKWRMQKISKDDEFDNKVKNISSAQKAPYELIILIVVKNYLNLLKDNEISDDLVRMQIVAKELDKMRALILSYPLCRNEKEKEDLLLRIEDEIKVSPYYDSAKEDIRWRSFVLCERSLEEAREFLTRLFDLQLSDRIENQINELIYELNNNPSETLFSKLENLKKHQSYLKLKLGLAE